MVVVASMLALALAAPAYAAGPYPGLTDLSAAKKSKLSPRLYTLTRDPLSGASANAQADGVDLPRAGAGSLVRSDAGALMVYVRVADTSDATLGELRAAGVAPTHVSDRYRVVTGFVMPLSLSRVASLTAVRSVSEAIRPQTSGAGAKAAGKAAFAGSFVSCGVAHVGRRASHRSGLGARLLRGRRDRHRGRDPVRLLRRRSRRRDQRRAGHRLRRHPRGRATRAAG